MSSRPFNQDMDELQRLAISRIERGTCKTCGELFFANQNSQEYCWKHISLFNRGQLTTKRCSQCDKRFTTYDARFKRCKTCGPETYIGARFQPRGEEPV